MNLQRRLVHLAYTRQDLRPYLLPLLVRVNKQAKIPLPPRRGTKGKVIFIQSLIKKLESLEAILQSTNPLGLDEWRRMFESAGILLMHIWAAPDQLKTFIKDLRRGLADFATRLPYQATLDMLDTGYWIAWNEIVVSLKRPVFAKWDVEDETSKALKSLSKLLREGAPNKGSVDPNAEERLQHIEYTQKNLSPSTLSRDDLRSLETLFKGEGDDELGGYFADLKEDYSKPAAYKELSSLWEGELADAVNRAHKGMAKAEGVDWDVDNIPAEEMANLKIFIQAVQDAQSLVDQYYQRIKMEDSESLPESESREQLYHASTKARQLFQNGFSSKIPDQEGLGGSQTAKGGMKGTSFTYDLHVAKEISRTLKEMTMIAQGKISALEILDWAKRDRLVEKLVNSFVDESVIKPYVLRAEGGDVVLQDLRGNQVTPDVAFNTPLKRGVLFKTYLRVAGQTDKRYDPYVMYLDRIFPLLAKTNIRDIGVVVATVDMTNPNISHLPGERELRVPPEAILSVDKFF